MRVHSLQCIPSFMFRLLFICLIAISLRSQNPSSPPAASATPPQTPVVRSYTRLVQVNVVVTDKKGVPISGLKKEDFTVLDGKEPQQIAVFLAASPALSGPVKRLPFNMFTNRYDALGEDPGSINIILFDALNTAPTDIMNARNQMIKFLKSLKPQDRVAIYALTNNLLILRDFTADSAALVSMVQQAETVSSSTDGIFSSLAATDSVWAGLNSVSNNSDALFRLQQDADRVETTCKALEIIADHVSGISGRKSLIWVSGGFPRDIFDPGGGAQIDLNKEMKLAMEAVSRADIAVYPVDVHGAELTPGMSSSSRSAPAQTASLNSPFFARRARLETFNFVADQTGGQAFYGNNDLADAARKAVGDGRQAYTLGFYPTHNEWNGQFRAVKVQVNIPGAELRYRKGYIAAAANTTSSTFAETEIQKAAVSPLEATALRLVVSVRHTTPSDTHQLEFQVGADVSQLLLEHSAGYWTGGVDLLFLQRDAKGAFLAAEQKHIGLNLPDDQYETLLKTGAIFERHLDILPTTEDVRVLVRDSASGIVGTVTIPLKNFRPVPSAAGPAHSKDAKPPKP